MSTGWQINRKRSEAIYESDSCPDRDVLASDLGLFKCTLNANCGNILFVQCSFSDTALFGGSAGRALRPWNEPARDRSGWYEAVRRPVSRVLSPARERGWMAIHLGRPSPDASRDLPGRRRGNPPDRPSLATGPACRPYLVLLPVGFTVPPPSPGARCALTAPFHPCLPSPLAGLRRAVCCLWHFP